MNIVEKKRVLIVDLLAANGHVEFVKNLHRILSLKYNAEILTSSEYCLKTGILAKDSIDDHLFKYTNRFAFLFSQYKIIKKVKRYLARKKNCYDFIIISSFENISFSIFWRPTETPTYTIIHNNLTKKKLSLLFFKNIRKRVNHICLSKSINNQLNLMGINNFYVPHPINFISTCQEQNYIDNNIIFSPSSSISDNASRKIIELFKYQDKYQLFLKGKEDKSFNNIIVRTRFNDYFELLDQAKYVLLPFQHDLRVSGVFFEAMCLNKTIICLHETSGLFLKEMKANFPNSVFFFNTIEDLNNIKIDKELKQRDYNKFIDLHSDNNILNILKINC